MPEDLPLRPAAWKHAFWITTLWVMGWLGVILWQGLAWSDMKKGLYHGAMAGLIVSPLLLVITVPLGVLGAWIGKSRPLRRFRRAISLIVPCTAILAPAVSAAIDRAQPERRFERFTGMPLPSGAKIHSAIFDGSTILADNFDTYLISCSAEDTAGLIRDLKLEYRGDGGRGPIGHSKRPVHEVHSRETTWVFVSLYADSTRTLVQLTCGSVDYSC
jgi:hypothetical protein